MSSMGEINWARATNHQHSKNGVVVSAPADLLRNCLSHKGKVSDSNNAPFIARAFK